MKWRLLFVLGGLGATTVLLTLTLRGRLPDFVLPDYISFWAAGYMMADGVNPYDPVLQEELEKQYGFREQVLADGRHYKFVAYYYPPWMGLLCMTLAPLEYETGRAAWLVVNFEFLLVAGWLLRPAARNLSGATLALLAALFVFCQYGLWYAQSSPLVLFSTVVAWRLLDAGWDRTGGAALAWLTFKPQMGGMILLGGLVWAASRQRWGVLYGFFAAALVLAGASFAWLPDWPLQLLNATRVTPLPTDYDPRVGTTWLLVLRSVGARGVVLWVAYLALALPLLGAYLVAARCRPLLDVFAFGCIVIFFISPYSQAYDFALLVIPWFVLLGSQPTPLRMVAVLVALLILPLLHVLFGLSGPQDKYTLFWVPVLLAILWLEREIFRANLSTH
jgi:hypothetical protein